MHPNFCEFCEICGRISPARVSVNSVKSVGESTHPNHLCWSVKSVGESPQQEFLWILWNLWENILSKKFCEFCEICGRIYAVRVKYVGGTLLLRRQGYLRYYLRTLTICVNLWNLWENILSKDFCEICVFCGRPFAAAEAGYLRYYENLWENIRSKCGFGGRAYNYHEAVMPLPHTCNSVTS